MNCFRPYLGEQINSSNDTNKLLERALHYNVDLIIDEMRKCYNQVSVNNSSAREASYLTENSNYLHRPTIDGELLHNMPQDELKTSEFLNSRIDVLIGLTSHESFYFLLHDYNINDILVHTLIYSSIINKTDNITTKLAEISENSQLNNCLKRSLFAYYNINLTEEELQLNSLKNKIDSIDMISDFDFVLPMITQLNFYVSYEHAQKKNKLFVYDYSHISSFNYLLDHLKSHYMGYDLALNMLNHSVVPHFSELDFVFGLPLLSVSELIKSKTAKGKYTYNYTREEMHLSMLMIDYWTSFAKYGLENFFFQHFL